MNRSGARVLSLFFSVVLPIFLGATAFAQTADEWVRRADQHYEAGRFAESADAYDQAIEAGVKNPATFYDAACSAALANRADAAFEHLDGALAHGWLNVTHLLRDSDLEALHQDSSMKRR
jgi:tetratricopeptide (TPR) repeat protein